MITLLFSYNSKEPFACIADDGEIKEVLLETDFYNPVDIYSTFPENSIKILLTKYNIDTIAFLGKPFLYIKNLIFNHSYFFPNHFNTFTSDISSFFKTDISIDKSIENIALANQIDCKNINFNCIYFLRADNSIAQNYTENPTSRIITCFSDAYEGPSLCIFETEDNNLVLKTEHQSLFSLSTVLKIYNETKSQVDLTSIFQLTDKGKLNIHKKNIKLNKNYIFTKSLDPSNDFSYTNTEFLKKCLIPLSTQPKISMETTLYHDVDLPDEILQTFPEINFIKISMHDKINAAIKSLYKFLEN